jgi:hypothetical protein
MSSLRKFAPATSWRIAATLACVAFAASPGVAAGRHIPHASHPAAPSAETAGGTPPAAGQAKPEGGDVAADRGGKAGDNKSVGPIDLTRPDDGYGNLRRRAARHLFIAAQKKPPAATTIALHPPVTTTPEHLRNSAGATVPALPVVPAAVGSARPEPGHVEPGAFGGAKNSLGLGLGVHPAPVHVATTPAPPKPPVIGINGTSLHAAGTGIGGPTKDHSAIGGSSYKHK